MFSESNSPEEDVNLLCSAWMYTFDQSGVAAPWMRYRFVNQPSLSALSLARMGIAQEISCVGNIIEHRRRSFSTRSVVVGTPLKCYYIWPAMSASQELIVGTYLDVIWACHAVWCAAVVCLRRHDCSERAHSPEDSMHALRE